MDANGTRFHLLQGEADWKRYRTADGVLASGSERQVFWNAARSEITLWPDTFRFAGAKSERPLALADRRGAARDRFGNWYWIAPGRQSILVCSSGSRLVSTLWPVAEKAATDAASGDGSFRPRAPGAVAALTLQGLVVTEDHYLVVGTVVPAGLLIFDLYAGGPPRQRLWPVAFEPFDLAERPGGGVWILDRMHRSVWQLDRRFDVVVEDPAFAPAAEEQGQFQSITGDASSAAVVRMPVRSEQGWPIPASDAVAVAALPAGGVLVLEPDDGTGFARVHLLEGGSARGAPVSTRAMATHVEIEPGEPPFLLIAHDFALGARAAEDADDSLGQLYIVGIDGNQAYAFDVARHGDQLVLTALTEYFPMRLFGGRALVAAGGETWYDCADTWVRLVQQHRPRYVEEAELWTPVLDSGEPACVWHRLMLDACFPPGSAVEISSRASDDWRELTLLKGLSGPELRALHTADTPDAGAATDSSALADWQPEPSPYLRGNGSELPYMPRETAPGRGTWEVLLQRARGRYLQLRLVLRGDGRNSPRLRALRVWYPRFSYLEHYLPAVYRDDAQSASFLDRFLANIEGVLTALEDRIAAAQLLFDVQSAPPDALDWLSRWFGVALDPAWEDQRRRLFIRHALEFFAVRGTLRGLKLALRLALDDCVDERLFTQPDGAAPVRIIERFRTRRTPPALLGDVSIAVPGPQPLDPAARWQPSSGSAELHRRYREALGLPPGTEFPLVNTDGLAGWSDFATRQLGFVPHSGAAERAAWQAFLERKYASIDALRAAHGNTWPTFAAVLLPAAEPESPGLAADWRAFLDNTRNSERRLWQDFLARRYRNAGALSAAWRTNWSAFPSVALPDRLPADEVPLADWFQFEGTVLAMHRSAHRFTVMLPVPPNLRTDTPAQQRRLALAKAVLDLEKPAHTVYDMRFYWAMFRLGEARLGDDTLIDLGSRAPELMAPMVLGEGYLAESYLVAHPGRTAPERLQIGRDRVGRSARIGGP